MDNFKEVPRKVKTAASRFAKVRADYYAYVASLLTSSAGSVKFMQLFENDAVRYAGKPRGILSEYWYETYSNNGGNLADTFAGTLPDDEIAILQVAQNAGGSAVVTAFHDIARMGKLSDAVKKESLGTLLAGLIGISIAIAMLTAFPIFSVKTLKSAYDFLPLEYWGTKGRSLVAYSEWVKRNFIYVLIVVGLITYYIKWTIPNLTTPLRDWLDKNVVLYRVIRDLKGALFLATMSTLTRNRGGVMFTLKQSLETFADSAKTPWLKWRIEQIIDGADATGAIGVDAFRGGIINEEMYFFMEDMNKAKGFAEGFEETGKYVETAILAKIVKQMTVYRWVLLISALLIALAMFVWQFQVIYEMRGAMSTYLATG